MAEERGSTPEKQLLNLIENQDGKGAKTKERVVRHKGLSFLSLGAWKGRISFFKAGFGKFPKSGDREFDVKLINKILGVSILGLMIYLGTTVYQSLDNMKRLPRLQFDVKDTIKAGKFSDVSPLKAASYYIERVLDRNIFKMGSEYIVEEVKDVVVVDPTDNAIEATKHLRLVGISWSNDPDAMVEDTRSARTFFVKRGQMIGGKIKVQAISKESIILMYEGQEVELR